MQRSLLAAAKRPGDLVDRPRPRRPAAVSCRTRARFAARAAGRPAAALTSTGSGSRWRSTTVSAESSGVSTSRKPLPSKNARSRRNSSARSRRFSQEAVGRKSSCSACDRAFRVGQPLAQEGVTRLVQRAETAISPGKSQRTLITRIRPPSSAVAAHSLTRSMYSPVRVSTLIRSPISTKRGRSNSAPVSTLRAWSRWWPCCP